LDYTSDKKDLENKRVKQLKKEGLKPIETAEIYKILSGKSLDELNKQALLHTFVKEDNFSAYVFEVYENYACVRTTDIKHVYWQFFKNVTERNAWLKQYQTNEIKLIEDDIAFIKNHTLYYKNSTNKFKNLKKEILSYPLLKGKLSDNYDIQNFIQAEEVIRESVDIKDDFTLSTKKLGKRKIIIFKGDLIVDGTLFITDNPDGYIIVKGDLKAKNIVVDGDIKFLFIEGTMSIENICYHKYSNRIIGENLQTDILLHQTPNILDLKETVSYKYEVSTYSENIIDKGILEKGYSGYWVYDVAKLNEYLVRNKPFLADNLESERVDYDAYYQNSFERRMLDWGYAYPEYAGCEMLSISEDNEIKGDSILPGTGDWVLNDLRGQSGTYGVSHEDYSIYKLKVKYPEEHNVDYSLKAKKLKVNAETLMERYQKIAMLYMNWAHRKTVSFNFKNQEAVTKAYENEKSSFVEDVHLALYWLNHFGATLDKRYDEVLQIVEANNLVEKLPILKEPIAFFKKTDAFYNLEIGKESKFKDLFLIRRAYLIYYEQVYKNYNPDNLDLWWKSITIYPKVEEQLIVRVRWLKNNLEKCNNWSDFDALIKNEQKNIPLLSYVFACNPNSSDKEKMKYADILVSELLEYKNHFKSPHKKSFAEILLWDVQKN